MKDDRKTNLLYPEILNRYIVYVQNILSYSNETVDAYISDIELFLKFSKKKLDDLSPIIDHIAIYNIDEKFIKKIDISLMHDYLEYIKELNQSSNTLRRKIYSLKSFYKFLFNTIKVIDNDPTKLLGVPKENVKNIEYITKSEMIQILYEVHSKNPHRDKLILSLFLYYGIRVTELRNIMLKDIDMDNDYIEIRGKKSRILPLNEHCKYLIKLYMEERKKIFLTHPEGDNRYLFISIRGNQMSRRTINYAVESHLKKININKNITPNHLRHTAAMNLVKEGLNVNELQGMLGNKSKSFTRRYKKTYKEKQNKGQLSYDPVTNRYRASN